jgi:hypothetical protein
MLCGLKSTVRLFADDSIAVTSEADAVYLQSDLNKLGIWEKKWKMLDLFPCLLQKYLVPLRWTISRVCMSFCVYGSHTVDAYSTIGLTSELYALCFVVVDPMFRFLDTMLDTLKWKTL